MTYTQKLEIHKRKLDRYYSLLDSARQLRIAGDLNGSYRLMQVAKELIRKQVEGAIWPSFFCA